MLASARPGRRAGAYRRAREWPQRAADPARVAFALPFRPGRLPRRQDRSRRDAAARPRCARREEEIGLEARFVEPLGWLDPYLTGTGFRIAPLVALVDPGFTLAINSDEVAEVFETPFAFLMDPANHLLQEREWRGLTRKFYAMPHEGRYIWGATAGILRNLYERLFS